jgi:uncharacterized protein (TIGR02646 family)
MIKLELSPKPEKLTDEYVAGKTQEYKKDPSKKPWRVQWLKDAVFDLAFGKCCYSEIRLKEEGKYMEVDHFHPTSIYPDEVMEWGNLLPSCKKCNITKHDHDTRREPIVHPFVDNPKDYFYIDTDSYRYEVKGSDRKKAELTLRVLGLNDFSHFVTPRRRIGKELIEVLDSVTNDLLGDYRTDIHIQRLKNLMKRKNRKEPYSALTSTIILSNTHYRKIESYLKTEKLWDNELQALKAELEFCSLTK